MCTALELTDFRESPSDQDSQWIQRGQLETIAILFIPPEDGNVTLLFCVVDD